MKTFQNRLKHRSATDDFTTTTGHHTLSPHVLNNRRGNNRLGKTLTRLGNVCPAAWPAATTRERAPKTRNATAAPRGPAAPGVAGFGRALVPRCGRPRGRGNEAIPQSQGEIISNRKRKCDNEGTEQEAKLINEPFFNERGVVKILFISQIYPSVLYFATRAPYH